jgi:hypothetical protein
MAWWARADTAIRITAQTRCFVTGATAYRPIAAHRSILRRWPSLSRHVSGALGASVCSSASTLRVYRDLLATRCHTPRCGYNAVTRRTDVRSLCHERPFLAQTLRSRAQFGRAAKGRTSPFSDKDAEVGSRRSAATPMCRGEGRLSTCAVTRRRFPVGARPTRGFAPAGSNRSRHGGDEMSEAFG